MITIGPSAVSAVDEPSCSVNLELLQSVVNYQGERNERGEFHGDKARFIFPYRTTGNNGERSHHHAISFQGAMVNGNMHGQNCDISWTDGVTYVGQCTRNKITGKGILRWPDGSMYEGDLVNGMRNGIGRYTNRDFVYNGEWRMGKRHGKGHMLWMMPDGPKSDETKLQYKKLFPQRYEGGFVDDKRYGFGTMYYSTGNIYEGEWRNGVRHGQGTMHWTHAHERYEGEWSHGLQHGKVGIHSYFNIESGTCNVFVGSFRNGKRNGRGVFYYADGCKYEGEWRDNSKDGYGEFIHFNGNKERRRYDKDTLIESEIFTTDKRQDNDLADGASRANTNRPTHSNRHTIIPLNVNDAVDLALSRRMCQQEILEEVILIQEVLSKYFSELRDTYRRYSTYGREPESFIVATEMMENLNKIVDSPTNSEHFEPETVFKKFKIMLSSESEMNIMQLWKFAKDSGISSQNGMSLAQIDRIVSDVQEAERWNSEQSTGAHQSTSGLHDPERKLSFRDFIETIVRISIYLYDNVNGHPSNDQRPSQRVVNLIEEFFLPSIARKTNEKEEEHLFMCQRTDLAKIVSKRDVELRRAFLLNCDIPMEKFREIDSHSIFNTAMTVRQFLRMMHDADIAPTQLSLSRIMTYFIEENSESNKNNSDMELVYKEFVDGLIKCCMDLFKQSARPTNGDMPSKDGSKSSSIGDFFDKFITQFLHRFIL